MTKTEHSKLKDISTQPPWLVTKALREYLSGVEVVGEEKKPAKRTDNQHRALFLWFSQIEQICANEGVTADLIFRHTSQIKITKELLHSMCKTLAEALYNIKSTKELEKIGHLDVIQEHFIDLFAKEGVELPPFPNDPDKPNLIKDLALRDKIYRDNGIEE